MALAKLFQSARGAISWPSVQSLETRSQPARATSSTRPSSLPNWPNAMRSIARAGSPVGQSGLIQPPQAGNTSHALALEIDLQRARRLAFGGRSKAPPPARKEQWASANRSGSFRANYLLADWPIELASQTQARTRRRAANQINWIYLTSNWQVGRLVEWEPKCGFLAAQSGSSRQASPTAKCDCRPVQLSLV